MSADLISQTSTTTGTGPFTLAIDPGFNTFASAYAVGEAFFVGIQGLDADGAQTTERLTGIGQLLPDGRLQVDSVTASSNGNAAVSFTSASLVLFDPISVGAVTAIANARAAAAAATAESNALSALALVDAAAEKLANKDADGGYVGRAADGSITLPTTTATPASPGTGLVKFFGRDLAKRAIAAMVGPAGIDTALQPFLGRNKVGYWTSVGNTVTTPVIAIGIALPTGLGTATARNVATTSLLTTTKRLAYVSAATAASVCGFRSAVPQFFRGLSSPTRGGFFQVTRFAVSDAVLVAGARAFVGMRSTTTAPSDADPSTFTNIIGVGHDAADVNWQVMHNDASGTATKVDTGVPVNNTSLLDLVLFSPPLSSSVFVRFDDHSAGVTFEVELTSDLPADSQLLTTMNAFRGNGPAGAAAVALDLVSHYVETDF